MTRKKPKAVMAWAITSFDEIQIRLMFSTRESADDWRRLWDYGQEAVQVRITPVPKKPKRRAKP